MKRHIKLLLEYSKELDVLYVEDERALADSTTELLENYFHSVNTVYDGADGLAKYEEYFRENDRFYDIVITDIQMPRMDGIELCENILKKNETQSIIITTAHNEINFLLSAIDLGIDGFLVKPLKTEQLIKVLFKTTRNVSDHKFVTSHLNMIESLYIELDEKNRLLEEQNSELIQKNSELEKSFRMLDTMVHKEQIAQSSTTKESVDFELNELAQEQIEYLISDDLYELEEIHEEMDRIIIEILAATEQVDINMIQELTDRFSKYASTLAMYNFFDKLGGSMKEFAFTLQENPLPSDEESVRNIFMLLEGFLYVLSKWQKDLKLGDISNINRLDASMISDMETILNMWTQKEEDLSEESLDDIFDF